MKSHGYKGRTFNEVQRGFKNIFLCHSARMDKDRPTASARKRRSDQNNKKEKKKHHHKKPKYGSPQAGKRKESSDDGKPVTPRTPPLRIEQLFPIDDVRILILIAKQVLTAPKTPSRTYSEENTLASLRLLCKFLAECLRYLGDPECDDSGLKEAMVACQTEPPRDLRSVEWKMVYTNNSFVNVNN
jgi:hypothetical protein